MKHPKHPWIVLALLATLLPLNGALSAEREYPAMRPDNETRLQWMREDLSLPEAYIDPSIKPKRGSFSLLSLLPYIPAERDQGDCGDCWVWAGTGCAEIAHALQGVSARLSIQYMNSCGSNSDGSWCCCGGNLFRFAEWYSAQGMFIPWSNPNALFSDAAVGHYTCPVGPSSAITCGLISTSPNYPISSMNASTIKTFGEGQATAIANIKNALSQNKAVMFSFWAPTLTQWNEFTSYWQNNDESALFDFGAWSGLAWNNGSGHGVLIVGYNDAVTPPIGRL